MTTDPVLAKRVSDLEKEVAALKRLIKKLDKQVDEMDDRLRDLTLVVADD